ncbi:MAG: carboxypeptidase M32 [Gemmataceae bacterium]
MTPTHAYADLLARFKDLAILNSCAAVLGWDQQTYMPKGGAALRGEQMAWFAAEGHKRATDPKIAELLSLVEGSEVVANADRAEAANVREWRHGYDRATKLPSRLVEELARVTTAAQQSWDEAKGKSDFSLFRDDLAKVVSLKREETQAVGYQVHPYDALIDEYEPGTTAAELKTLFSNLSKELVPLIAAIANSGKKPDPTILDRVYPVERQKLFAESAGAAVGFDFTAGRLDTTSHPFCSGFGPGDCRITTRYNPRSFVDSFFGVLHEAGHGLYEQNLPKERFGEPSGSYCSLGIHESQSRLWENQVGRSPAFWTHFFPRLQQTFPTAKDIAFDDFLFAINDVKPSFIRVEADEVTYNLHVAIRFELELALLDGQLPVADLPQAWNDAMKAKLGITVPDDRRGCLQDVHWSFGGLGYFPTYTLGNLYAAQLMESARKALPDLDSELSRGDCRSLKLWLGANVHSQGRIHRAGELCRRATGNHLTCKPFIEYVKRKFGKLYGMY